MDTGEWTLITNILIRALLLIKVNRSHFGSWDQRVIASTCLFFCFPFEGFGQKIGKPIPHELYPIINLLVSAGHLGHV